MGHPAKSLPLLIDCLDDGRLTNMRFDGNTITKAMNVPVGYLCFDILMSATSGRPVSDPKCSSDGLGACMNVGFYFRPDDYSDCFEKFGKCDVRPWIKVVKINWIRLFRQNHLQFHNPYDNSIPEYKEFRTPKN